MEASQPVKQLKVPDVGTRGGLGRTLLTAFLLLAILPLSIISWYATARSRLNIQEEVTEKLDSIAALKETQISRWVQQEAAALTAPEFTSRMEAVFQAIDGEPDGIRSSLEEVARLSGVTSLGLLNPQGQVEWANDASWEGEALSLAADPSSTASVVQASLDFQSGAGLVLVGSLPFDGRWPYFAANIAPEGLTRIVEEAAGLGETGRAYLVDQAGMTLPQERSFSGAAMGAVDLGQDAEGLFENDAGVAVIGVYHGLADVGLTLVVEQSQEEAFAGNNAVATHVIAMTLGVALVTAVIAAFVTRQITRSVVNLTESALRIAAGDLSQRVEVTSRDEIGILARVFNRMASELQTLYRDLEAKVAERTRLLQEANYQIQRRAIQLQASLEVGQAVTSVLDPDKLLEQVVRLVKDSFVYSYVAVYTAEDSEHLLLRTFAGDADPFHGDRVPSRSPGVLGRAFRGGTAVTEEREVPMTVGPPTSYTRSEVVLPLRLGERTLGVLDVQSTGDEGFDHDDVSVLQNVANQITIALENARAYVVEREAVERLQELDQSKRQFLANMSHELRTPLTNIIGFSQLMLREIGGPITPQQQNDLEIVYHNSQHLLGLINDLLDVSHIEAGLMELEFRQVELSGLIRSVMATASALVGGKVTLREEISGDLPQVQADPTRIRQVLLRLLANAAKFTEEGSITVRAWSSDAQVLVSVSDTGVGIPPEDRERIFGRFEQGTREDGSRPDGAGLGLALSKEFVEMHGGRIWVESEVGQGSTFTFTLPLRRAGSDGAVGGERQTGEAYD